MTSRLSALGLLILGAWGIACHPSAASDTADHAPAATTAGTASMPDTAPDGGKSAGGGKGEEKAGEAPAGGDEEAAPAPVVRARTAVATVQRFIETLTAIGSVAARPGRYAELSAPAPTRVTHIYVAPGDEVAEGAPLVEFDRAPFDAAAASAAAALTVAEHGYGRVQQLAAAGIVPRKDVDQAAADLAQARTMDVTARRAQELATLRAPLSGIVTHLSAALGASVDPTQPVVGIADPSALDIVLALSPTDGSRVRPGDSVIVTAGQGGPGESLGRGVVSTVGIALDTASRTLGVRARVSHPARTLRIGETVTGRITTGIEAHALTIPVQALVPDGDGVKVFVVGTDGVAHARAVMVGERTDSLAQILDGLHAGETVVTEGAYGVEDSAKVVPVK